VTYTATFTFTLTGTPTVTYTPKPILTVSWGDGFASTSFNNPSAIAVQNGSSIYVYVADTGNNRVEKFTNTGSLVTSWGAGGKGKGTINFTSPQGLAVTAVSSNSATLFVSGPNGIGVFDAYGNYLTTFTNSGTGLVSPKGLALDGSGNLFVSDTNQIVELSPSGAPVTSYILTGLNPTGLAVDTSGNLYAALGNNTVEGFSSSGVSFITVIGFNNPDGLAMDSSNDLFVADTGNKSIEEFPGSAPFQSPTVYINPNNELISPVGVAVDSTGEIYVVDSGNSSNGFKGTVYNFAP
jgi:sugar lactone lactonase YvrE